MEKSRDYESKKSIFTVKNILRALSIICIIIVFCPVFLVSCSGQEVKVNVMTAVGGVSSFGEKVVSPHPIMLLCLLIPIAIFVLLIIKKYTDRKNASIIAVCGTIDLVIWIIFRLAVKHFAENNYCGFETTGWYIINIFALILIILLTLLVVVQKLRMNSDLALAIADISGDNNHPSGVDRLSNKDTQFVDELPSNLEGENTASEKNIQFCIECGSPIEEGYRFCSACGAPVQKIVAEDGENINHEAE